MAHTSGGGAVQGRDTGLSWSKGPCPGNQVSWLTVDEASKGPSVFTSFVKVIKCMAPAGAEDWMACVDGQH